MIKFAFVQTWSRLPWVVKWRQIHPEAAPSPRPGRRSQTTGPAAGGEGNLEVRDNIPATLDLRRRECGRHAAWA